MAKGLTPSVKPSWRSDGLSSCCDHHITVRSQSASDDSQTKMGTGLSCVQQSVKGGPSNLVVETPIIFTNTYSSYVSLKMMRVCGNLSVAVLLFRYKRSLEDTNAALKDP